MARRAAAAQAREDFRPGLNFIQNEQIGAGDQFRPLEIEAEAFGLLFQVEVWQAKERASVVFPH